MSEIFSPFDHDIIKAFLDRESQMYSWKDGITSKNRQDFIDSMFNKLVGHKEENPCFNRVYIQSITDMGLVESTLVLSSIHLNVSRDLWINLPPSPKGGINFSVEPHEY